MRTGRRGGELHEDFDPVGPSSAPPAQSGSFRYDHLGTVTAMSQLLYQCATHRFTNKLPGLSATIILSLILCYLWPLHSVSVLSFPQPRRSCTCPCPLPTFLQRLRHHHQADNFLARFLGHFKMTQGQKHQAKIFPTTV